MSQTPNEEPEPELTPAQVAIEAVLGAQVGNPPILTDEDGTIVSELPPEEEVQKPE